jgi:hypothetical protein
MSHRLASTWQDLNAKILFYEICSIQNVRKSSDKPRTTSESKYNQQHYLDSKFYNLDYEKLFKYLVYHFNRMREGCLLCSQF